MFKPKTLISKRLENSSGGAIRTTDLRVMSLTISLDHDVIDGAPAARFIHRLKKLVEKGYVMGNDGLA